MQLYVRSASALPGTDFVLSCRSTVSFTTTQSSIRGNKRKIQVHKSQKHHTHTLTERERDTHTHTHTDRERERHTHHHTQTLSHFQHCPLCSMPQMKTRNFESRTTGGSSACKLYSYKEVTKTFNFLDFLALL